MLLRTEFFNFLKNPKQITFSDKKLSIKFLEIGKLFSFNWALVGVIATFFNLIFKDQLEIKASVFDYPFFTIIWAPILEEITFRLQLKVSKLNLVAGITLLPIFIALSVSPAIKVKFGIYGVGLIIIIIFLLLNNKFILRKTVELLNKNYFIYFYSVSAIFALVHLSNPEYVIKLNQYGLIASLAVVPQFICGTLFGFIRLKYGISFSIFFHMFHNSLVVVTPFPLLKSGINIKVKN